MGVWTPSAFSLYCGLGVESCRYFITGESIDEMEETAAPSDYLCADNTVPPVWARKHPWRRNARRVAELRSLHVTMPTSDGEISEHGGGR